MLGTDVASDPNRALELEAEADTKLGLPKRG